ncbi:MAG TPA: sn-glycerol-3-phosphate ABC transporter ATP-binding protein UgpC [Firmicutes bacterium]|nr:sn-glycerol-3-phosphate ABC transporter ATP-binding protein UgpC [Bacillota bacterium]
MANVTLRHIYKVYAGGVTAVNDFNLAIKDKEFIVLVGPSGCGKSTTLRMIAGLEEITEGELYIGDKLMNDVAPKNRDIAMVFQNYALYPHMTVYDNMAFGLKLRKVHKTDIDKKVKEAAKILGIEEYLQRKPKALSGGQKQRVALGRAIVREPQVFLMDEPLSNLDAKLRVQMRTEITKLHNRLATTFIYVTHDQTEAMTMGTRIVVMKDGFIQQVDSPQNLYDYPCNKFVAGFIGSPAMNFIDCTLVEENGNVFARFGENKILIPEGRIAKLTDKSYIGREVTLGIRPDDIHDEEVFIQNYPQATVSAYVELIEKLGFETLLYLTISGKEDENIVARVNPRSTVMMNDTVKMVFDPNRIHLFDKETEISILSN